MTENKLTKENQKNFWNKQAYESGKLTAVMREDFLQGVEQQMGISADYEKFIHGLNTGSHKVPPRETD